MTKLSVRGKVVAGASLITLGVIGLAGADLVTNDAGSAEEPPACTVTVQPSVASGALNSAYQSAAPGETLCLATGNFGYQLLQRDSDKAIGSERVTIQPAPGASPVFTKLALGQNQIGALPPNDLTIRDFFAGYPVVWGSRNVSLLNLSGRGFDVFRYDLAGDGENEGADVLVKGGDWGPCEAPRQDGCTVRIIGTRIVVDGVTIHDVTSTDLANYHVDGMFVRGCVDCKVLNSKWYGNYITNIRVQNCCLLPANRNLEVADNWFGCPLTGAARACRGDGIDIDNDVPSLHIHHNSYAAGTGTQWAVTGDGCCTYVPQTDAEELRNIAAAWPDYAPCNTGARVTENARTTRPNGGAYRLCGSDVFVGDPQYVNPSNGPDMDYRLRPGSPAAGYGSRLGEPIPPPTATTATTTAPTITTPTVTATTTAPTTTAPPPTTTPTTTAPPASLHPPIVTGICKLTVNWKAVTGATGYRFYVDGALASTYAPTTLTTTRTPPVGVTRRYGVSAIDATTATPIVTVTEPCP
jgi:hypothetical protein